MFSPTMRSRIVSRRREGETDEKQYVPHSNPPLTILYAHSV